MATITEQFYNSTQKHQILTILITLTIHILYYFKIVIKNILSLLTDYHLSVIQYFVTYKLRSHYKTLQNTI